MAITRVNFEPLSSGGDNPTQALVKLDANDADLDSRVSQAQSDATSAATAASSAASAASAAQTTANNALPKSGGTINGSLTVTANVQPLHVNLGVDSSAAAGTRYLRAYTLADKTAAQVQMLFSAGSTAGNDGTVQVYASNLSVEGGYFRSNGIQVRAGTTGANGVNHYNFYWTNNQLHGWVDSVDLGYVNFTGSDIRIKQDVDYISDFDADLDVVVSLKPAVFSYKKGTLWDDGKRHRSFIADDAYNIDPMLVGGVPGQTNDDGSIMPIGLDPNAFFSRLVGAIKSLKATVQAQASTITALTERIAALESAQGSSASATTSNS